ncbi:Ubiquitin carrier protein [Madurella fahalii]|uniref:Ubiquitin carrier protein n=1 Tax=Madurella fahalii TaxID=1157608 RepID=A0ABQ0GNH7_9PEZI
MLTTVTVGGALVKRLADGGGSTPDWRIPTVAWYFAIGDVLLFLPVLLIIGYTFNQIYPVLAAVEDPLPAYEAVPMNDDDTRKDDNAPVITAQEGKPITSSVRATNRLLRSLGGWASNFRGFGYMLLVGFLTLTTVAIFTFIPFLPLRGAHLFALIALAPVSTTWTHVVITPPSSKSFFSRIPSARKTYIATALPIFALWSAAHLAVILPALLGRLIGFSALEPGYDSQPSGSDLGKALCVGGVSLALQALLVIPAFTALTRVQASLLPADEDTIVPFDRSFGGRVEPEVVSGKGFASISAALRTVSCASWMRIYLQRVKLFGVAMGAYMVIVAVVVAQMLMIQRMCTGDDGSSKCS